MISTQRINEQFKIVALHTVGKQALFLLVFLLFFLYSHFNRFNSSSLIDQNFFSSFGFLVTLASILYSIAVFDRLRSRHAGLYYLMVPATAFEKFVVSLIYTTVVIFLVYTLSFFLVHALTIGIYNMTTPLRVPYSFPPWIELWDNLKTMLFFQSMYFLGAVLFKRNPFVKTSLIILCSILIFSFIASWVFSHHVSNLNNSLSITWNINDQSNVIQQLRSIESLRFVTSLLQIGSWLLPFACWGAAYYRIKTIQI